MTKFYLWVGFQLAFIGATLTAATAIATDETARICAYLLLMAVQQDIVKLFT